MRRLDKVEKPLTIIEPWKMTRAEWESARLNAWRASNNALKCFASSPRQKEYAWGHAEKIRLEYEATPILKRKNSYPIVWHRDVIKKALAEGKPVPHKVLADYPDLAS